VTAPGLAGPSFGRALREARVHAGISREDLGWSTGMHFGVKVAHAAGRPVELRRLGGEWQTEGEWRA